MAASTTSEMAWNEMPSGSSMTITPAKPTATAVQRRQPTCSASSGTDSPTMKKGAAKEIA